MNREFRANRENEKWVSDITEFKINNEKVYLAAIMDLYNNEIIAYKIAENHGLNLVISVLEKAVNDINPKDILFHNDQGGQYSSKIFQNRLKKYGMVASMSRAGNCLDNACMESFFGHLKCECIYNQKIKTKAELKKTIEEYIEFYNVERLQAKLDGMSPIEYKMYKKSA